MSRVINGSTGKVVHEVVTDGSVYWGANDDPGNTNETAQFATTVELLWRWSGDNGFRDEMYPFVVDGMRYITSASGCPPTNPSAEGTCDDDDNDGWPEGFGMVERTGMGEEKLDNTVYTWQALRALQRMAESKGDNQTAKWADREADAMEAAFDAAWWMANGASGGALPCQGLDTLGEAPAEPLAVACESIDLLGVISIAPDSSGKADAPGIRGLWLCLRRVWRCPPGV